MFRKTLKIKYFADVDKVEKIAVGDWIDLRTAENVLLKAGESTIVPLGVGMILPKGYEALLVPRSSTFKKFGVLQPNSPGVIDEAYCGEKDVWKMPLYATRDVEIPKNTAIAQFRIEKKMPKIKIVEVDKLNEKSRGGFGSTDKK